MKNLTTSNEITATDSSASNRAHRRSLGIAAAAIAALSFSSCSSIVERATEKAVEEGIERAIEADSGENVELDFDSGDGTFSIETDEGSFSVDGEDGTFVLETEDGTFEGSGDENGYEVTDENGSTVIDADFDADGDGENGSLEISTDDGSFVSGTGDAAWDLWPGDLERPDFTGETVVTGTSGEDGALWLLASGEVDGSPQESLDAYADRLDGFTVREQGTNAETVWVNLINDDYLLSIVVDGASSPTMMSMTLTTEV